MIVRTHVAFGGGPVVFVGHHQPWRFGKGTQAFSRKLERLCELVHLENDEAFFDWSARQGYAPVAVEIAAGLPLCTGFRFPERAAIAVGNEKVGLPTSFLERCEAAVSIPQFGQVGSLNVAISHAIAVYEANRARSDVTGITGGKFATATSVRPG